MNFFHITIQINDPDNHRSGNKNLRKDKKKTVEKIKKKLNKNQFLETVFGFSKKRKMYFLFFWDNREGFKKPDINEELW